jgi:membrane-associated phospholipid phosphatase
MTLEVRLWIVSGLAFAGFLLLGYYVTHTAQLPRIDVESAVIRGQSTPLASFLTFTGRGPFLAAALVVTGLALWYVHASLRVVLLVAISQLASQAVLEGFKHVFARHRPDYWLIGLERGFSYPSGHASTAITFFCAWACIVLLSSTRRDTKLLIAATLVIWAAGIVWSRLALGAHYLTDVAGGILFGVAWICSAAALYVHFNGVLTVPVS